MALPEVPLTLEALEPVVSASLSSSRAEVLTWSTQPILGGLDRASTVDRVTGTATVDGEPRSWSVVLKTVRPVIGDEEPSSPNFWLREASAYRSGLLHHLAEGLVTPRCLAVDEQPATVRIWLEDIDALPATRWRPDQVLSATRRFGVFHGSYLARSALPSDAWLVRGLRRRQAEEAAPGIVQLATMAGHPLVEAGWPGEVYDKVLEFWDGDRLLFLDALDRLPQSVQHGDASTLNLFARPTAGGEETVVIDWAWLGIGALGEDLAVLWNWFVRLARRVTTDKLIASYVSGLREAGWVGDERVVRLGWALTVAVRYLAHPLMLAALDPTQRAHFERHREKPLEELLAELSEVLREALVIASEARELLRSV